MTSVVIVQGCQVVSGHGCEVCLSVSVHPQRIDMPTLPVRVYHGISKPQAEARYREEYLHSEPRLRRMRASVVDLNAEEEETYAREYVTGNHGGVVRRGGASRRKVS